MSHEPFSLFHDSVLILIRFVSVMIHCISLEASMRAKQFMFKQQQNLGRRFGASKMHLSPPPPPSSLGCCPFQGGDSVLVDLLFNVLPIFCGDSVFVLVLGCISLCTF